MLSEFLQPPPHVPRLLEVHEVAYYLRCSQEQVRRLIRAKTLIGVRLGTRWRVDPLDLKAFIDARRERADLDARIAHGEHTIDRSLEEAGTHLRRMPSSRT